MSDSCGKADLAAQVVAYLNESLKKSRTPEAGAELKAIEGFEELCAYIQDIKETLLHFSNGDFDHAIKQPGATAGFIKALQSNIRHLAWQCYAVADGDLDQRVEFLGALSKAFNRMTEALVAKQEEILSHQAALTKKTEELQIEIKKKEDMAAALRASEEMYRQRSLRDPRTGLYNRGYFFESVTREIEKIKRQKKAHCCLVMMDIDFFKKFNDTYGHLCGDQVLKMVAVTITGALRKSDILARYGGEEFSLFLANADLDIGTLIAERIRTAVANRPSPAPGSHTPVTVSIGLCHVDSRRLSPSSSGDDLLTNALKLADEALYVAKDRGRNMVWTSSLSEV